MSTGFIVKLKKDFKEYGFRKGYILEVTKVRHPPIRAEYTIDAVVIRNVISGQEYPTHERPIIIPDDSYEKIDQSIYRKDTPGYYIDHTGELAIYTGESWSLFFPGDILSEPEWLENYPESDLPCIRSQFTFLDELDPI